MGFDDTTEARRPGLNTSRDKGAWYQRETKNERETQYEIDELDIKETNVKEKLDTREKGTIKEARYHMDDHGTGPERVFVVV